MKSHEVLKQSVEGVGVKMIAPDLGVSPSLLYKWCQPGDEPTDSGATNPLDRLAKIFEATGDEQIISWICQKADGFFCPNPKTEKNPTKELFAHTQRLVSEFSDLLQVISESSQTDKEICFKDSEKIRKEWEELKGVGESFVKACEEGFFQSQ